MKITNKMGLPVTFVKVAEKGDEGHIPEPHKYSVTELIMPLRALLLRRQYYDAIERDVADCIPTLFGTAVHQVMQDNNPLKGDLYRCEEKIETEIGEDTLSGQIDLLDLWGMNIEDYKTCSVSKVMKEEFDDWYKQGMAYAWLVWRQRGIILKNLRFYALMKDWSKIKSTTSANYPQSAIFVWQHKIEDSDYDFIEKWIRDRLRLINEALSSGSLPECTAGERWSSGDKWAVYKKAGDKRAAIVCDTEQEAQDYVAEKGGSIEFRKGEDIRCKYYCDSSRFCEKGGK